MKTFTLIGNIFRQIGDTINNNGSGRFRIVLLNFFVVLVLAIFSLLGLCLAKSNDNNIVIEIIGYLLCSISAILVLLYTIVLLILIVILIILLIMNKEKLWTIFSIILSVISIVVVIFLAIMAFQKI